MSFPPDLPIRCDWCHEPSGTVVHPKGGAVVNVSVKDEERNAWPTLAYWRICKACRAALGDFIERRRQNPCADAS